MKHKDVLVTREIVLPLINSYVVLLIHKCHGFINNRVMLHNIHSVIINF